MNQALGHFYAQAKFGQSEPREDGEMKQMPLPSRHMIRNSNPRGLRQSSLPPDSRGAKAELSLLVICCEEPSGSESLDLVLIDDVPSTVTDRVFSDILLIVEASSRPTLQ